ncbi:aldolase/citrate lyase family protein [Leptospira sp. GIMC2001]|uniref:aldolase/citrate lyase family protein n=1 Tax=Leptospira sp. GIMC2001 TaxID=1513297 RepID=UPI00234AE64F|nr:aldolase/citrate lyase family protein [Leptospira sp. GIMC2001]WCL51400.1 aldolase/citrate lyase family protein [Leptospira sp. GIMC2001]
MSNLKEYLKHYPILAIKTGTETEDMGSEEILYLKKLCANLLPVYVKIGGPEARNDMRICQKIGVEGISAPMIESEYALRNFISSLKNVVAPKYYQSLRKSINLETITGYKNYLDILDRPEINELDQITAARSDLSASMDRKPDDPEVTRVTRNIVRMAKERGLNTCVGGTITKKNFDLIREEIQPDFINSRHIMVDVSKLKSITGEEIAEAMLSIEIEIYELFAKEFPEKSYHYKNRIETNRERIGERKVLYFIR